MLSLHWNGIIILTKFSSLAALEVVKMITSSAASDANFIKMTTTFPFNTLSPRQDGRHFADDIFKCIFLNENVWIPIKISLKFVPKGPINNIPAWLGAIQALFEPMMVNLPTHVWSGKNIPIIMHTVQVMFCCGWQLPIFFKVTWLTLGQQYIIFQHYWSFVSDSTGHGWISKEQWWGVLMFPSMSTLTSCWTNGQVSGDLIIFATGHNFNASHIVGVTVTV